MESCQIQGNVVKLGARELIHMDAKVMSLGKHWTEGVISMRKPKPRGVQRKP